MDRLLCFLAVFALLCATGYGAPCNPGWTHDIERGSCIAIPTGAEGSWAEAMAYCNAMGSQLAVVESTSEHNFLVDLINSTQGLIHDQDFWLGALDVLEEGVFVWANSMDSVSPTFWGPGQPDNANSRQGCLRMEHELDWLWGDGDCTSIEYFVCETEARRE